MTTQPEALRLAGVLWAHYLANSSEDVLKAVAELRRLHEAHDWQHKMAGERLRRIEKLEAENEALRVDAERWRTFLSTQPPNTHEAIIAVIDEARSKT